MSYLDEFRAAMRAAGIEPPDDIEDDGKIHRFSTNGKPRDRAGWYILHGDGLAAGAFADWRSGGERHNYCAKPEREFTTEEKARHKARMRSLAEQHEAEQARKYAHSRERAARMWASASPLREHHEHAYLRAKQAKPHGTRVYKSGAVDLLVVPLFDAEGELHSLQFIGPDGRKRYLAGGRVSGCFYMIDEPREEVIFITEGFATGAAVHESTGEACAVAFSAGNLGPVALALRSHYPGKRLVIAGDNDANGVGERKGREAARAAGAAFVMPRKVGCDWSDVWRERGEQVVALALWRATRQAA